MVIFPVDNILKLFLKNGTEARYVGGCVRDYILQKDCICDYDIAVNAPLNKIIDILSENNIKISLINFAHNTLVSSYEEYRCDITSLRKDISTDGRHAKTEFTDSWFEDSLRRDFTINSLYMDINGNIYDFHNGIKDLKDGNVIFIGDIQERIEEDFLRILRFFRFHASFSKGDPSFIYLKTLKKMANKISKISRERIRGEFIKILKSPNFLATLNLMNETDLLENIFGRKISIEKLEKLSYFSCDQNNYLLKIILLFLPDIPIDNVNLMLVLTKKEKKHLNKFLSYAVNPLFQLIYYLEGGEFSNDFLIWYSIKFHQDSKKFYDSIYSQKFWHITNPILPIKCYDLKNIVKNRKDIGILIKKITLWWCSKDFSPDKNQCLKYIENEL